MTVAFDNTILSVLLNPQGRLPLDPVNQKPLEFGKERVEALILDIEKSRRRIILPAPALAELMTAIGPDSQQYVNIVSRSRVFDVGAFDARAAAELAILNRGIFAEMDQKNRIDTHQKRKVDRQIVAICKVYGATVLYTDDLGLSHHCRLAGVEPVSLGDLPVPDGARQGALDLLPHDEIPRQDIDGATSHQPI